MTLDSTLARARSALAIVSDYFLWDWETAEREFKHANRLNPSLAINHYHYAWYLHLVGRNEEAVAEHEAAVALDPLNAPMTAWMGDIYRIIGQYDRAEEQVRKALDLGDQSGISQLVFGWIRMAQGRMDDAVIAHEEMVQVNPLWTGLLGATYAAAGREEDARRVVDDIKSSTINSMQAYQLAILYAQLGDSDPAFEWANYEPHHAWVPWLTTVATPFWPMRTDPRFDRLRNRINLPPLDDGAS